jgi:hypothetical protein
MHPSFGIEFRCPSFEWNDLMKGPSRQAVLDHTHKFLHYRSLFDTGGAPCGSDREASHPDEAGKSARSRSQRPDRASNPLK